MLVPAVATVFLSTITSSLGNFVNLSSTEVHVVVGGTANITCSYPIYLDHSFPLIGINGSSHVSIDKLPQSRYNVTAVPNNDGTLCTLTLSYRNVTASDNGTSYRFLVFIGSSRETESDPVRLYVHKPEDPPNSQYTEVEKLGSTKDKETLLSSRTFLNSSATLSISLKTTIRPSEGSSQLSTTTIIVIGVVCGGVCLVMLGIMGVTCLCLLVWCKTYSPKGEAAPEESLTSDDVKMEKNPAHATVEYNTASEVSLTFDDVKIEKNPAYATVEYDTTESPRTI